jgi:predicted RNA-binding protein YlqC (UPF0109 family)
MDVGRRGKTRKAYRTLVRKLRKKDTSESMTLAEIAI